MGGAGGAGGQLGFQPGSQRAVRQVAQRDAAARKVGGVHKVQVAVGAGHVRHLVHGECAAPQGDVVLVVVQGHVHAAGAAQVDVGAGRGGCQRGQCTAHGHAQRQQKSGKPVVFVLFHGCSLLLVLFPFADQQQGCCSGQCAAQHPEGGRAHAAGGR